MGMTLKDYSPVAVVCTSGSAAMNFYPAVAEAFYQKLPLVLITADRPLELIDQGVGQTVRQQGVYGQHIVIEANLLRDTGDSLTRSYNQRVLNEAMLATENGPVHINVPFDEPLYDRVDTHEEQIQIVRKVPQNASVPEVGLFAEKWNAHKKILILAGHMPYDRELVDLLEDLNSKSPFLVLTESVSNLPLSNAISTIDRVVNTLSEDEVETLQPDLLLTIGGEIVSKMIKSYLVKNPAKEHWHLSSTGELRDTFQQLTGVIKAETREFFRALLTASLPSSKTYPQQMLQLYEKRRLAHEEFMKDLPYSDLSVFGELVAHIPENTILHTANSASIRYIQLFEQKKGVVHHTNRGTSGIDGCSSTALGHAHVVDDLLLLITGDIAFLYDSNAFWSDQLPSNLRVIVINNGGGNIFRIIKGPEGQQEFETYQESIHDLSLKAVGDLYNIDFRSVSNLEELRALIPGFLDISDSKAPAILEVNTPRIENPKVLEAYFEYIRSYLKG